MKKCFIGTLICLLSLALISCGDSSNIGDDGEHTHDYGEWKIIQKATCTEDGVKEKVCSCGKKKTQKIEHGHTIILDAAKAPTCTDDGFSEGSHCSVCGEIIEAQTVISAVGHADNNADNKCDVCGGALQPSSEGLRFVSNGDGTCYVSGIGSCTDTDIVIPSKSPDGDAVISIGYQAFRKRIELTSVTIGNSVTSIEREAFSDCTNLGSITIPDSVTNIGQNVFSDTAYYTNDANWTNKVLYIGKHLIGAKNDISGTYTIREGTRCIAELAFYKCTKLTNIIIPNSITSIGAQAFNCCENLVSINIPDGVTSIGEKAFYKCRKLKSISIPNSVTIIDRVAFADCTSLTSITIPDSVKSIGDSAFDCCYDLKDVTIGNGVQSIGNAAFEFCTSLTSITIPDSVTNIEYGMFFGCRNLTNVIISDSVTSIEEKAFYGCSNLTSIIIPDSVTSIGKEAFYYCGSLKNVYYTGTADEWSKISLEYYGNDDLTSATRYYYSETQPTDSGNYWHYVDGKVVEW